MHNNIETVLWITIFSVLYLSFTIRQTARRKIDFYDFIMLSTVAIFPWVLVSFPALGDYLTRISGVAFPFVIMFGGLFSIVFIFIHRLVGKVHMLENDNRILVQELSILKERLSSCSR